jgi:hypothetical protein
MTGVDRLDGDIAELVERHISDLTVVDAGHFVYGSVPTPVARASWVLAVRLVAAARLMGRAHVGLSLLVDDLGVPAVHRPDFRRTFVLPPGYDQILAAHELGVAAVELSWEVRLRNRAHGDLRSRLRSQLLRRDDGFYVACGDGSVRPVTRGTTPVCNLIVARHVADHAQRYASVLNIHDLGWECQMEGGTVVAREIYGADLAVSNMYLDLAGEIAFVVAHPPGRAVAS